MGVVYRAWNLRQKGIEAVKVIAETLARDRSFRERFEHEIDPGSLPQASQPARHPRR